MSIIATIDDETITADDFIKLLKLNDKFETLAEELLGNKLAVHAAKKSGVTVTEDEVQERVDQYRRVYGLHRAQDTIDYLEKLNISVDEFGHFIEETLYYEKVRAQVQSPEAVEEYFTLNSPKYESIELSHIILNAENIANEILALLEDEPDTFADLAKEHSLSKDTSDKGGSLGKIFRGALAPELEAKLFNAEPGDVIGPFCNEDELLFEIFRVDKKYPAECDTTSRKQIHKLLFDEWLSGRTQEHKIEVL